MLLNCLWLELKAVSRQTKASSKQAQSTHLYYIHMLPTIEYPASYVDLDGLTSD